MQKNLVAAPGRTTFEPKKRFSSTSGSSILGSTARTARSLPACEPVVGADELAIVEAGTCSPYLG